MLPIQLLPLITCLRCARDHLVARIRRRTHAGEAGQGTVEYAIILLGAAIIGIAFVTWATSSGRIGDLFDTVFDELQSRM